MKEQHKLNLEERGSLEFVGIVRGQWQRSLPYNEPGEGEPGMGAEMRQKRFRSCGPTENPVFHCKCNREPGRGFNLETE